MFSVFIASEGEEGGVDSSMAALKFFSTSEADLRNSRMALPKLRARSGRRLLPKRRRMTRAMMRSCGPRIFVINPRSKFNKFSIFIELNYLAEFLINSIIKLGGLRKGGFEGDEFFGFGVGEGGVDCGEFGDG